MTDVRVELAAPFAGVAGEPTLSLTIPTTPGFSIGATISQETAWDLIAALAATLERIENGAGVGR